VYRKLFLPGAVAVSVLALSGCGSIALSSAGSPSSSGGGHTKAKHPGTGSYTIVTQPAGGYTPIYHLITSATKTLDMTMYELVDTTAEQDLASDARNGVTVRVILDGGYEKSANTAAYDYLKDHGVHVVWASSAYAITHQKTVTADDSTSAIMTGNLTSRYYSTTRDFAIMDTDKDDVTAIEKVFDADFAHRSVTPSDADHLVWSPTDSQSQILALINGAKKSLAIENEEMNDTTITSALEKAAKRGVDVKVTMTRDGDAAEAFNELADARVHVRTYADDETTLYIHAKVIVADGAKMFVGSENFSSSSLTKNRELGFLTTNGSMISTISSTLTSDYDGASTWSRS